MGVSLYRTVKMGDMQALYFLEETERHMSLMLLPEGMEPVPWENKKQAADSLVPVSYTHLDVYKRQLRACGAWLLIQNI